MYDFKQLKIEIILATTPEGEIGYKNTIPWRLNGDLNRFKRLTMGNIVIMGRNTYESLPAPLEGRTVIVVSETLAKNKYDPELGNSICFVPFLETALVLCDGIAKQRKVFIAGGVRLYEEALTLPNTIVHLTTVYKKSENGYDAQIKNFNLSNFVLTDEPKVVYEINRQTHMLNISHTYSTYKSKGLHLDEQANKRMDNANVIMEGG
jgi:dihydrofolate reductase